MSTITTNDGTEIYYKDWGEGPVVTFSHGWPLNSDAWDGQMLFLAQHGFRAVAHDRRGPKTSNSSMFRPWCCTARTTRSFPSRIRR
jgi:non-heme chloroperoxidase